MDALLIYFVVTCFSWYTSDGCFIVVSYMNIQFITSSEAQFYGKSRITVGLFI